MTKVKICGITNVEDALAACAAGADALGFVFAPEAKKRNRYISADTARKIIKELPPFVSTVAVCVNDTLDSLRGYLEFVDFVQLCGEESPEMCNELGHRAIKAFHVGAEFDMETVCAYDVGAYLLDASVPDEHGGTGKTCDWETARRLAGLGKPIILAGGLSHDNVAEAVRLVQPYAVDVSGGVESAPGKKDHERVREFINSAKA